MSKTRHHGGRWVPGISGNPSGRPKIISQVRDVARGHTVLAIERLVSLVDSADEKIALAAAEALLNRGWGRCEQSVAVTTDEKRPAATTNENRVKPGMTPQEAAEAYMQMLHETGMKH